MANYTASRLGLAQGGSDNFELFLKTFSGEVLAAFEERNVMMPLHTVRTIQSGKSASFPLTGTASAAYHTPGNEITGNSIDHAERVINIDNLLIAHAFIANLDEAMNHYDVRGVYSRELGYALANHADKAIIRSTIAASLDATDVLGNTYTGGTITGGETGDNVIDSIIEAAQTLDERSVPMGDRFAVLTPAAFYAVLKSAGGSDTAAAVLNKDYGPGGSVLSGGGQIIQVAGVNCLMSTHVPTANEDDGASGTVDTTLGSTSVRNAPFNDASVSNADADEGYSGADFRNYQGVVFHRSAVGTVKLMDLAVESDYQIQRQGSLMVARYAMGHNYLRAEAAVGIKSA
tara:strand:+ start:2458 stop:3495 length:1038 start_codon:yes stop_codon:yes gene_type:complete